MTSNNTFTLCAAILGLLFVPGQSEARSAIRGSEVIGTFFNEVSDTVQVNLISSDRKETIILTISPGQIDRAILTGGETRVYVPSENVSSGRLLSSAATPTLKSAAEFFDKEARTFYLRVAQGRVTLVKPQSLTEMERKRLRAFKRQVENDRDKWGK